MNVSEQPAQEKNAVFDCNNRQYKQQSCRNEGKYWKFKTFFFLLLLFARVFATSICTLAGSTRYNVHA